MEIQNEAPAKKPKRLTSVVWNHFERVRKADTCYAVCVHCQKKLSGSSNSGTTHLRNHLVRCLKRTNFDVTQILSAKRKRKEGSVSIANVNYDEVPRKDESVIPIPLAYKFDQEPKIEESINLGSVKFDQERSRLDLARMVMLHDYPPGMVDHIGFKIFVKNLQPMFEITTSSVIESDCVTIYLKERKKVSEMLRNLHGRINLAVGLWSSPENVEYLCLTANYVDEDWKLQKKLLNFLTLSPSQTDDVLSDLVINCLQDWAVDRKLFTMTLDDCSSYDDVALRTKDRLMQNKPLLKNGEFFDVRCASYLVRSIFQDAMEALQDVTEKIRESVRYAKSSLATQGKLDEFAQQIGINTNNCLVLDNPMRWNSTCHMLETALEYRGAFSLLQEHDPAYTMALSDDEWQCATSVTTFMKNLVDVTKDFSQKHPTANMYFFGICDVHLLLLDCCKSGDDFVSSLGEKMKSKFDKYWNKCILVLAIAVVLDPRFKMKLVEYYYKQIYTETESPNRIREVSKVIRELFNEYSIGSASLDESSVHHGSGLLTNGTRDRLRGFDKYLHETSHNSTGVSDLDKYLEEPMFPRHGEFNILNWWKVHTPRYPILSMMARDILGIPVSTLTPEMAFSTGGRVLDNHLKSVSPEVRQALVCGQDWLRMEPEDTNTSSLSAIPLAIEMT